MEPIPTSPENETTSPHSEAPDSFTPAKPKGSGGGKKAMLVILVLLLIGGAAFGAWYYQQRKIDDLNKQITSLKAESDKPAEVDKTNVLLVGPASGTFTAQLPEGWAFGLCANEDVVFLAPSNTLLGRCSSESGGTVSLVRTLGAAVSPESDFAGNADLTYNTATVAGVGGIKVTYTQPANAEVGPPAGTKVVIYQTVKNDHRYTFSYHQNPGDADNSAAFEQIVSSVVIP